MRTRILPVLAVGLVVAACGGGGGTAEKAESSGSSSASETPKKAKGPEDTASADAGGKMTVTYDDATTPEAQNGKKKLLQDNKVLEDLADDINSSLKLPIDIPLHGSQCNQANAFWSPSDKTVTICYEDADLARRSSRKPATKTPLRLPSVPRTRRSITRPAT